MKCLILLSRKMFQNMFIIINNNILLLILLSEKTRVHILHDLSYPVSGKTKENISNCCLLKFEPSILNVTITKTCLYDIDPLKPHFYIVKLGFTGVYIIFFISAQNINCGYSLEPPRRGGSNEYPQSMF